LSSVKRLLPAALAAVAIHGLLLAAKPRWHWVPGRLAPEPISVELQVLPPSSPAYEPRAASESLPDPLEMSQPQPVSEPEPLSESEPESLAESEPEPEETRSEPVPDVDLSSGAQPAPRPDPKPEKPVKPVAEPPEKADPQPSEPETPKIPATDPPGRPASLDPPEAALLDSGLDESPPPIPESSAPTVREAKPEYLENESPKYPRIARRRGYSGTVVLEVLVSGDGRPEEVKVFSSSGYRILDESALSAVAEWRFEPGTINGVPVSMRVKVPVRFALK
jgi:periplasmic protein TonB